MPMVEVDDDDDDDGDAPGLQGRNDRRHTKYLTRSARVTIFTIRNVPESSPSSQCLRIQSPSSTR